MQESARQIPDVLMPKIECIHPGATRNHNRYVGERLRGDPLKHSGIYSWTYPYPKPICYDHDTSSVRDISGRVYNAQYITNGQNGKEAVVIIPKITNKEDIRRILDGEFLTVSISASTDSAVCNICGTDLINEEHCGHWRGETYDGVTCEYIIGDVWFDECSWVTVPADQTAQIVDLGLEQTAEAYAQYGEDIYSLSRDPEHAKIPQVTALSEGLILKEGLKKPESKPDDKDNKKEGKKPVKLDPKTPIDFATVAHEDVQALINDLVAQLDEKDTAITTITAEKNTVTTEKETIAQEKSTVETQLTEANTKLADTEAKLQALETEKADLEKANATHTECYKVLSDMYHESVIDRIIDYKVLCSKISANEKEAEKEILKTRSQESLKDTLSDLTREFTGVAAASLMNSVKNPASGVKENNNENDKFPGKTDEGTELDPATILKNRLLRTK